MAVSNMSISPVVNYLNVQFCADKLMKMKTGVQLNVVLCLIVIVVT